MIDLSNLLISLETSIFFISEDVTKPLCTFRNLSKALCNALTLFVESIFFRSDFVTRSRFMRSRSLVVTYELRSFNASTALNNASTRLTETKFACAFCTASTAPCNFFTLFVESIFFRSDFVTRSRFMRSRSLVVTYELRSFNASTALNNASTRLTETKFACAFCTASTAPCNFFTLFVESIFFTSDFVANALCSFFNPDTIVDISLTSFRISVLSLDSAFAACVSAASSAASFISRVIPPARASETRAVSSSNRRTASSSDFNRRVAGASLTFVALTRTLASAMAVA